MILFLLAMIASPPPHCPPAARPRLHVGATREDWERSGRAQKQIFQLVTDGDDKAALPLVTDLIRQDVLAFGEDADPVVFEYTLLAMIQANGGASGEAQRTVRRIFGIPPESPLFTYVDPDDVVSSIGVYFDYALGDWSAEGCFRFLVDTLAAGGHDQDAARAAALQWFGRSLTLDDRLVEARIALSTSLDLSARTFGKSSPRRAECFFQLALVDEALCDTSAARQHYIQAAQLALRGCERQQSDTLHYLEDYGKFLRDIGSPKEAEFVGSIEGNLRSQLYPH